MTQARSTLPAHLQRARLATIAKDPAFRRYFASADDSATIRMVLVRLFDSQGKRREQLAIEREARSRRSQQASKRRKERNHSSNSTPERSLWDEMVARERRQERLDRFREEREHDLVRRQRKLDESNTAPTFSQRLQSFGYSVLSPDTTPNRHLFDRE